MRENCEFVVPVNILTLFARALFSWAARHITVCLDSGDEYAQSFPIHCAVNIVVENHPVFQW